MEKGFEHKSDKNFFVYPSLEHEMGEIERVAKTFYPKNEEAFIKLFLESAKNGRLVDLDEEIWSNLENTDSYEINESDWKTVDEHVSFYNNENRVSRDWKNLKEKMEQKQEIDAPIIFKQGNNFHLVSGNTRLMTARALGETPKVLIVEIKDVEEKENRGSFFKRLEGKLSREEIEDIDFAYDIAKEAHRPAQRDGGGRYFEHPRAGCLIMTDELGLHDRDMLISFFLHDVGEDTPMLGNVTESYDKFREKAELRLTKMFGPKVADNVIRLTKPSIDKEKFRNRKEATTFYLSELGKSEDAIILKMVDRLHNLRSLSNLTENKEQRIKFQINDTREKYLPIFESVRGDKKEYADMLVEKIKNQLEILGAGLSN